MAYMHARCAKNTLKNF